MSVSENNFGDLYSDYRNNALLLPDADEKFQQYLKKIDDLSKNIRPKDDTSESSSLWQNWEIGIRQIYKEMVFDAFKAFNVSMPKDMEVYFAGSLAKAQATEYSDLDAFVIVKNEADALKAKPIFDALNNLCQRIFKENKQLYPDPIGINPGRLIGTPERLFEMLKEGEVNDLEPIVTSILTSKPILPRFALGEELRNKIRHEPDFSTFVSAKKFYATSIEDFPPPKQDAVEINIKSHVMRPVDFILMGLREEFNLYNEDGSHLTAPGAIRLLREQKLLPEEQIALIESTYQQAMEKRFALHAEHQKEHDKMPAADATELLQNAAKIRTLCAQRIERLDNLDKATVLWKNANTMLEKENIQGYLNCAQKLNQFIQEKNINSNDLKPRLGEISPKGFAVLAKINKTIDQFPVKENLEVKIKQISAVFKSCVSNSNQNVNTSDIPVKTRLAIYTDIRQFKKDIEKQTPSMSSSSSNAANFKQLKALHTQPKILANFREQLTEASNETSLNEIVQNFKRGKEYSLLKANGRGAVAEFDKLVEETRKGLNPSQNIKF